MDGKGAQPLGELHPEYAGAPTAPRPQRRDARGPAGSRSSVLPRKHPKSLHASAKRVLCRICEDEYPQSVLREHTTFCVQAAKADSKNAQCNDRLRSLLRLLEEHRQRVCAASFYSADTYAQVGAHAAAADARQYGSADAPARCLDTLSALQSLLVDLPYDDVGLVTYARRLSSVIEEKWANMKELARIQRESARDRRRPLNLWGLLSLARPHLARTAGTGARAATAQPRPPSELLLPHSASRTTIDDFEILKRISSGAYGKVYLARKKKTRDLYAVKIQNKSDLLRKNMVDSAIAERRILSNVRTPFVVKLYYAFQNERHLYLVMEYCPGGDLATLLRNLECFDLDMARVYAADIVRSLEALHSMAYVHRDLKPDNILVNAKGHLLLTDFGLSSVGALEETRREPTTTATATNETTSTNDKPVRVVGTPDYLAPEMLLGTGHGPEVDWWALGIMLYEFLTGCPPFNDTSPEAIFGRILRRDIVWPDDMDADARDLIERLLTVDPAARLGHRGADEVKAHPFFAEIDWDTLLTQDRSDYFVPRLDSDTDTSYHEDHRQTNTGTGTGSDCSWNKTGVPQPAAAAAASGGATFSGFEFTNTSSLLETTLSLASEQDDAPVDGGS